ncbi:hypothetical protein ECC02_002278 [Trypanosoma cruzi]|uniref:Uncharacterized protein n=1 Tax=Trypanosoma cruzi TaxID=5693 RepID=A0A7J6YD84_TRYCR|nr:hypothetical protein ECC02_002278 [Trypanosoma cruzi]
MARSLPQDCVNAWHVGFLAAVRRLYWKDVQEEKEDAHTARQALYGLARTLFLMLTRTSCPEWRHCAQARCDSCPLFDRPARALRITSNSLCVSVAPSLPHCGDRPASASAGTTSRREHHSFPASERRIEVLLPKVRHSALVHPQYEGTCRTCSAWRYNSLRRPPMRMPQWRHHLLNRCLARGKHKRGHAGWSSPFRHRFITDATGCESHGKPRENPPHPLWECPVIESEDCDCLELPQHARRPV